MRRSLTLRLALLAALWVAAGLALAGWFIAGIAERQIEAAADARLSALLDAVVAAAATDASGRPRLTRPVAGPELQRPLSGQYWQITGPGGVATSRSLWDARLPPPVASGGEVLARDIPGPRGNPTRLLERHIELPDSPGPLLVQVAMSREGTLAEIARLRRGLTLAFALVGIGLVGGLALQVVWGLRPLRRARQALAEVRAGKRDRLGLDAPAEIAPLVAEIDALIEQNRATVERARSHLGNLAHALKTPVAVLRNALDRIQPPPAEALAAAGELERVVQHHLARARASALSGSPAAEAAPCAVAEEVASALRRLQPGRVLTIEVEGDAAARVRADRQDLIEMIGNLMENACKWAESRISVRVAATPGGLVRILVEDDGPGLAEDSPAAALARGVRLDESRPGAGLGLAIVADLAGLHGGRLELDRSAALGGAAALLELPAGQAR